MSKLTVPLTQAEGYSQSTYTNNDTNESQACEGSIKIRLKYSNDNGRLVEGRLQENIGVFKRRNFSDELSSNKMIRLLFQGKELRDDEASLSSFGLHDNCVVHCSIHQPHPTNARQITDPVNHDISDQPLPNMRHYQRDEYHRNMANRIYRISMWILFIILLSIPVE